MQRFSAEIIGENNLPITLDITSNKKENQKAIVIFCHGFKGFKDWGAWNLVAEKFAKEGFIFLKFNFSHNGTSPKNLLDFENIKAFSENNYTKELNDLQTVIDWAISSDFPLSKVFNQKIYLIGHSRGGGAVLVKSYEEEKIVKTCTWASIDSYERFGTAEQILAWQKAGEHVFINGRTGQKMPINYQFYQDFLDNKSRLNIQKAVENNQKKLLVIHGLNDPAVSFQSAKNIANWSKNANLLTIKNADHVFGSKHPYTEKELPEQLDFVVEKTIYFFKTV